MAEEKEQSLDANTDKADVTPQNNTTDSHSGERSLPKEAYEASERYFSAQNRQNVPLHQTDNDVATNDGAVIETLDTAFHGKPGVTERPTISGSNRADYYETRSYGKTDAEEELDALHNNEQPEK